MMPMRLPCLLSSLLLLIGAPMYASAELDSDALELASVHALVARLDAPEGDVLVARRSDVGVPIASVTKLMSAVVVLESGADLDAWLDIRAGRSPLVRSRTCALAPSCGAATCCGRCCRHPRILPRTRWRAITRAGLTLVVHE